MTEKQAIIFELDNGDRVVAVKDGRHWQPKYADLIETYGCEVCGANVGNDLPYCGEDGKGPCEMDYSERVGQSTALWTLRALRRLCAGEPEAVRAALVGGES